MVTDQTQYNDLLKDLDNEQLKLRFDKILDIRKFEIELYWKRATYFWAFIGVSFTVYGLTLNNQKSLRLQFLATCLGLLFSLAFFMVNKASKFWQENWERHTDFSENAVIGPLYKVTIPVSTNKDLFSIKLKYSASVSRINIYISFVLIIVWLILFVGFCLDHLQLINPFKSFQWFYYTSLSSFTLFSCYYLLFETKTGLDDPITIPAEMETRNNLKFVVRYTPLTKSL